MTIYPAIDLRNGRCVRLQQGDPDRETVFSDDPVSMAEHWIAQGAEWLHVVDLDGAFSGGPRNAKALADILRRAAVPVQLGGGLRTAEHVRAALELGVRRAILGTAAIENPSLVRVLSKEYPDRIAVGIDAQNGRVATHGWTVVTETNAVDLARQMADLGASTIIYTDIARDGMLEGVNIEAVRTLAESVSIPVIASGGVSSLDDVRALIAAEDSGIAGVIIGRALYDGRVRLAEAIHAARPASRSSAPE